MPAADQDPTPIIRAEQVRLLYEQTTFAVLGNVAVGVLFVALLWTMISPVILALWAGALIILAGLRIRQWRQLKQGGLEPDENALNRYCLIAGFTGAIWGVAGVLPMLQANTLYQIFGVMICAGISGASLATLGSHFRCYARFLFITMGPVTVALLLQSTPVLFGTGILAVIYILTMATTGRRFSEALFQSLNLTHEKQALIDELRQADESKSEYLARMSHEIRTPLNGVLGMAELLRRTGLDSRQAAYLNAVSSSGKALMSVVNEILDYSRIAAGKLTLRPEEITLEELATESLAIFTASAEEKGLKLLLGIEPDVPEVIVGDPARLRQIIVNLVSNAIKFTDQGSVTLSVENHSKETNPGHVTLRFKVSDTGVGIPEQEQKGLFEPFTQAQLPRQPRERGSGLGLNISRRLVELMGGEINVISTPGKGSVFRFSVRFPLPDPGDQQTPKAATNLNLDALVVEASPEAQNLLRSTLSGFGVSVIARASAADAKQTIRERLAAKALPDLLITDYHLPDTDGVTLCHDIASMTDAKVQMILLTPLSTGPDRQSTKDAQISGVVTAPITPKRLLRAIEATVDADTATEAASAGDELYPSFRERKLLVAEDDPVNRVVISEILKRFDCDVTLVEDGQEALDAFNEQSFDLVLMDCEMPRLDGCEAAANMRRLHRELDTENLPIIAMTAHTGESIRHRMEQAGMDDCMIKPLDMEVVHQTLCRWLCDRPDEGSSAATDSATAELTESVLDQQRTERLSQMMEGDLSQLASIYERQTDDLMGALTEARLHSDKAAMRRHLHALIGASGSVGAERVAHIAEELRQEICRNGVAPSCDQTLSEIRIEIDRALNALLRVNLETAD
ncbi:MAG: response regulator [Gammaproteobacteria bacterium]